MYNTKYATTPMMFDCLHYYVRNNIVKTYDIPNTNIHQIITYCLRPDTVVTAQPNIAAEDIQTTSFDGLWRKGVTSQQLYQWSTPVDVIEDYQWYLDTNSLKSHTFYNCTHPWFGPLCQYAFELETATSLDIVVKNIFLGKGTPKQPPLLDVAWYTCYVFLKCTRRSSLCLDWREVCDGSIDCDEGTDEADCWQLEITECSSDQYRCHNGAQCIPVDFRSDDMLNAECLDSSDKQESRDLIGSYRKHCINDPSFRCEESMCHSLDFDFRPFVCGDGQCAKDYPECLNGRDDKLLRDIRLMSSSVMPNDCALFATCLTNLLRPTFDELCYDYHQRYCFSTGLCGTVLASPCPSMFDFPVGIKVLGHVRFLYNSIQTYYKNSRASPSGLCYNASWCQRGAVPFKTNVYNMSMNGSTLSCFQHGDAEPYLKLSYSSWFEMIHDIQLIFSHCSPITTLSPCHPSLYKCINSTKCISKHRFHDDIKDCPHGDDELYDVHALPQNVSNDMKKDMYVIFEDICDGYVDVTEYSRNMKFNDESDCDYWPCNNTYSRCDKVWACLDGADELGCPSSTCSSLEHECVSIRNYTKVCLPVELINNGIVDCVGASDERVLCTQAEPRHDLINIMFHCSNTTKYCIYWGHICDGHPECPLGDDEHLCELTHSVIPGHGICNNRVDSKLTKDEELLCDIFAEKKISTDYFLARNLPEYPVVRDSSSTEETDDNGTLFIYDKEIIQPANLSISWYCNRGLRVRVRNGSNELLACLCPPAYFGSRCQYQSQRVSLIMLIRTNIHWRQLFSVVFTLIDINDNEQIRIHSQEQVEYLGSRDCNTKFNINLLYDIRPKPILSTNYSVRVDVYARNPSVITYYATWLFPIVFSFLPVNRMAFVIAISEEPSIESNDTVSLQNNCEWCAPGSYCAGKLCICPLGKFGSHCLLIRSSCDPNPCKEGGTCVPMDVRIAEHNFTCICPSGFFGSQCQLKDMRIDIHFDSDTDIPESLFIHFIEAVPKSAPVRSTIFKRIAPYETAIHIYRSKDFHLAFTELNHKYNLLVVQNTFHYAKSITTGIHSSRYCSPIRSILNESMSQQHLFVRIKFYHIPCRENLALVCFYDEIHMCICDLDRHANCFLFNHSLTYNCQGGTYCANEGQCFQDHPTCPTAFYCSCAPCFFGDRCQFSSKSLGMSLDTMLGYHIIPDTIVGQQPRVIKITMGTTIFMFISSLISSFFAGLTFQSKVTRKLGCGCYLFGSAINIVSYYDIIHSEIFSVVILSNEVHHRSYFYTRSMHIDRLFTTSISQYG